MKLYRLCWHIFSGALIMVAIGAVFRALLIGFGLRSPVYWGGAFDAWQGCALYGGFLGVAWYCYEYHGFRG